MSLPADLEPAVRDPKKLRRTAWILVGIMVAGGWLVLKAYEQWSIDKARDTRPAKIHRIRKERDLRVIRQDGGTVDLFELRGKVWAAHVMDLSNPESAARSLAVMQRLAAVHAATPDFHLVTLVVNPVPAGEIVTTLGQGARQHGMRLPQWWLCGTEAATMHKFIKSELKASLYPHIEAGAWAFDSTIVLIDREGHLRRAVVPQQRGGPPYVATFDFDMAAGWDREGRKTGTGRSNEEEMELLLRKTIDTLLAEPANPS
jgi:hypothetical protein